MCALFHVHQNDADDFLAFVDTVASKIMQQISFEVLYSSVRAAKSARAC